MNGTKSPPIWPLGWRMGISSLPPANLARARETGGALVRAESEPRAAFSTEGAAFRRDPRTARLEAVLFLSREPLSTRKIAQIGSLADGTEARTLVGRLNQIYDRQGAPFRVEEVAGGFQLYSRPKFGPWLRRLHRTAGETRLSSPALETLAVVAYRQPVLRADIEAIRGAQCGEMLRQLMDRDLVRILGRSTDLGRPFLYGTTRRFLQTFGLRRLEDMPRAEALRPASLNETSASRTTAERSRSDTINRQEEIPFHSEEVTVTTAAELEPTQKALFDPRLAGPFAGKRARTDEDEEVDEDEGLEDDEEEEDDGLEDDDEEEDDEEDEDLDDDFDDDDFEDEDWEEVDDEDEDWEDDDEEDDDDDWDDDEDEDEEDWEEEA